MGYFPSRFSYLKNTGGTGTTPPATIVSVSSGLNSITLTLDKDVKLTAIGRFPASWTIDNPPGQESSRYVHVVEVWQKDPRTIVLNTTDQVQGWAYTLELPEGAII